MVATEPLRDEQLDPIGWGGMEGVEDARNLIHYYRLTPDRRLVMGGGPVGLTWANSLHADDNERAWEHLQRHMRFLFPSLADARITHRWGGPFSVTTNLSPAIGCVGTRNAFYSLGCIGHGVSMSHLNACTLRDLVLERQSDLSQGPFVNRRLIPWPPEPLRLLATGTLRGYLRLEDRFNERGLPRQAR
jgi:glycine/D-amino acid oxidase-like deaminating enzyme